jgi:hypothetical protein
LNRTLWRNFYGNGKLIYFIQEKKGLEKELKYRINNLTADIDEEKEKNVSDNNQRIKTMEEKVSITIYKP